MIYRKTWLARSVKIALGAAAVVAMTAAAKTAHAQDFPPPPPDGGPGGPGGPGGFGGGRGPMGRGGMMRGPGRPASLSAAPIEALTAALNLSETQETKIKALQKTWHETERTERENSGIQPPRPPQFNGGGGPPSDEDREAMRAQFQKFMEQQQAFEKKMEPKRKATEAEMSAVLTDAQKKALPDALKSIDALQQAGIPPEVQTDLKLSAEQRSKLATLAAKYAPPKPGERPQPGQGGGPGGFGGPGGGGGGRRGEARAAVMSVLTDAQKKTVTDWEKAHPRPERGPGGFGGPGGPGGGGPDGFPPPPPPGN